MKKISIILSTLLLCIGLLVSSASALPIQLITDRYLANGQSYDINGVPAMPYFYGPGGLQAGTPRTLTPGTYFAPDGIIDSTAVGRIDTIATNSSYIFNQDTADYELTVVVSGIDDVFFDNSSGLTATDLYSLGLKIDIYMDTTKDFGYFTGAGAGADAAGPMFGTTKVLELRGHLQDVGFGAFDLKEIYNIPFNTFNGTALLDVVGGTWKEFYDTNTVPAIASALGDPDMADFSFEFSLGAFGVGSYKLSGTGEGIGDIVPEPGTFFLFGIGLLGIARIGRKRTV